MTDRTHTLIISDLHLGSRASSSPQVLKLLQNTDRERLILLGDVFDHNDISKLKPVDWDLLTYLEGRAMAGDSILWLKGNHDREFPHKLKHLEQIPIMEEYAWEHDGKKYLAIHGDKFDTYIQNDTWLVWLGETANIFLTFFKLKTKLLMNTVGKLYGSMLRLSDVVSDGALEYAKQKGVDYIICGHTHMAVINTMKYEDKDIYYINSGSWTQHPLTYVTVNGNGPEIHEFQR